MDLNRASILGNVTRTPELRTTPGGQQVCSFGIATNQQWTGSDGQKQQRTEFHNLVAWGKLAEICSQYLAKGSKAFVEGRLQTREWETPEGQKRNRTEIVVDNLIMLDRKAAAPAPTKAPEPEAPANDSQQEIDLDSIPF